MFSAPRTAFRYLLAFAILGTLASCSGAASAKPGQRLWTIRATGASTGPSAIYDPYSRLVISLSPAPSQDDGADPPSAITAVDSATGHQAWNVVTDQAPQLAMSEKGLVLVATSGPGQSAISPGGGPPSVWVLNDRTGAEIRTIDMAAQATVVGLTHGIIIAYDTKAVYGYSPITGVNAWRWHPPHGCTTLESAAASALIAGVLTDCTNGNVILTSINPATGTTLWSRTVGYRDMQPLPDQDGVDDSSYQLSVQGSYIAVTATGSTSNYSASGKPIGSEQGAAYERPFLETVGHHLVIVYATTTGGFTVTEMDTRTSASRVLSSRPLTPISVTLADGTLYILAKPPWPLLPVDMVAVDLTNGFSSVTPLPFPGDNVVSAPYGGSFIFSAPGKLLLGEVGGPTLAAYALPLPTGSAPDPGIQPAAARMWPRPCSLITARTISEIVGDSYVSDPHETIGGPGLPDASACEYAPLKPRSPVIKVGVAWEAKTTAGARELMAASAAAGMNRTGNLGDQAYSCRDIAVCAQLGQPAVLVRVGQAIAVIQFSVSSPAWRPVASKIATALRRQRTS